MTDRLNNLEKQVDEFLMNLGTGDKEVSEKASRDDPPHLELIDFDILSRSLGEIKLCLQQFRELESQAEAIRNWLTGRIAAFDKARAAILMRSSKWSPDEKMDKLSLVDLLYRYQEASASLRKLNDSTGLSIPASSAKRKKEYLQFKS